MLEGTAKGGVIIGIQEELGVPVQYIGGGEAVEDLQPFDPADFVKALFENASVVRPTLLYINSEAVIPAKAGIQLRKTGFRVKPGMTIEVKGLMTHYTR